MKIRTGFVSNSSSTSFMIVVLKGKTELEVIMVKALENILNSLREKPSEEIKFLEYGSEVNKIKFNIKDLKEEVKLLSGLYEELRGFLTDPKSMNIVSQYITLTKKVNNKEYIRFATHLNSKKKVCQEEVDDIADIIMAKTEKIKQYEDELATLQANKGGLLYVTLDLDHHGQDTQINLINNFEKAGLIKILKKKVR